MQDTITTSIIVKIAWDPYLVPHTEDSLYDEVAKQLRKLIHQQTGHTVPYPFPKETIQANPEYGTDHWRQRIFIYEPHDPDAEVRTRQGVYQVPHKGKDVITDKAGRAYRRTGINPRTHQWVYTPSKED